MNGMGGCGIGAFSRVHPPDVRLLRRVRCGRVCANHASIHFFLFFLGLFFLQTFS